MALAPVKLPILSRHEVGPEVCLFWLKANLSVQPGQFFMVGCGPGLLLRRPIAAHQESRYRLALLVRGMGKGTSWLIQRDKGETLDLLGPLGRGFSWNPEAKSLLLIAGGMGIAPLVLLAQRALRAGLKVTLVLGARSKGQVYPPGLLPWGLKLAIATEDGSLGRKGLASELAAELAGGFDQVFAAGPADMYRALLQHPQFADKPMQVSLEVRLGCGFGGCLGCSIPTRQGMKLVCRDGPVFDPREIIWEGVRL